MHPPVFFLHFEEILHRIVAGIEPAGNLVGQPQAFGPVKPVIGEKKPERNSLQQQECDKGEIPPDEKEDVSQGSKFVDWLAGATAFGWSGNGVSPFH